MIPRALIALTVAALLQIGSQEGTSLDGKPLIRPLALPNQAKLEADLKMHEEKSSPRELRNNEFGRHVDELMQGWLTFIAQAFPEDRAQREADAQHVRLEMVQRLTAK